jgi:hypothetical protein
MSTAAAVSEKYAKKVTRSRRIPSSTLANESSESGAAGAEPGTSLRVSWAEAAAVARHLAAKLPRETEFRSFS